MIVIKEKINSIILSKLSVNILDATCNGTWLR